MLRSNLIFKRPALFALLGLIHPLQPARAEEPARCPPGLEQDNNNQPYHFKTSSRLDPTSVAGFQSQIVSCVENKSDTGVIINWRLGGYDGAVGALDANDGRPFPIRDQNTAPLDSCLAFGGRPDTKRVGVLVPTTLAQILASTEQGDCLAVLKKPLPASAFLPRATDGAVPVPPIQFKEWSAPFRGFYPDHAKDIDRSLLRFEGRMVLFLAGDGLWQTSMQYGITPYRDSKGIPEQLSFQPEFPDGAKTILAAFREKYPDSVRGSYKGDISFRFIAQGGQLAYFSIAVQDADGVRVGSFPLAIIAP